MTKGFKIGRLFGININIDWSWLFIFFLITWNLSVVFGQFHANWGVGLRWGLAAVASLLFFASVLAHELAHSLMAKAQGVSVRSITLFLFGGVSNIQREPPSPGAEFLITIVGPITSIVLGIIIVLFSGTTSALQQVSGQAQQALARLNPVTTMLVWLGPINILLGVFNMIPGFPLDGGRILRSVLWAITDNLRQATRWASMVGQGIAWLFIFAGISMIFGVEIPFFGTGIIGGVWLAFIGWFLNTASVQSYRQVVVQDVLEDVPVFRVMRRDPPTVRSNRAVSDLVHDHVMNTDSRAFPVVDNGSLKGLVTLEDIRNVPRHDWDTTLVQDIMTSVDKLVVVSPHDDAADTLTTLMRQDVNQVPVVNGNGGLSGIVRRKDIIKYLQLQSELNL